MEIRKRQGLTEQELHDIRILADICDALDGIKLKLNWVSLQTRPTQETNDFLIYENGDLVGYLGIYSFQSSEAEISGMVHPLYRRRGMFTQLVDAAVEECRQRGFGNILFINHHRSTAGQAFLVARGTKYKVSEHWMRCERTDADLSGFHVRGMSENNIQLHVAREADKELLVQLNVDGFDMKEADSRDYVERTFNSPLEYTYIAEAEGQPIGKLGLTFEDGSAFIYGFCVSPLQRGKGNGRRILVELMNMLQREQGKTRFELEVAVENARALGIYEDCGFHVISANDYYELIL
ncbi:GNAT family N-acetyltransferase [Paenibacillus terrigena]|uniref:GNAT family N-acetyltransferase n=1 Tax=Paenibacillus terrigena TaxID=369333 RepID=UPI0003671915|nr:GNAT family N-acetyltransferase [Paenibacillus terrigena]